MQNPENVKLSTPTPVINKMTNQRYYLLGIGLDCTNDRNGTPVAHYLKAGEPCAVPYICELTEFWNTFKHEPGCDNGCWVCDLREQTPPPTTKMTHGGRLTALPVIHLKTGNPYLLLGVGIDCTKMRKGALVAHYVRESAPDAMPFIRELQEFSSKFNGMSVLG